ncbi:MAG TPA: protein kinase [Pirellulales bacterium]|jgi:serine/threonine-protein kinase
MQFTQLGPYKIGKRLGRGGMGAVFAGVNVETGEAAAIKVLNPHLADDVGFRDRFETEIDTLKKLRHPNIVRMFGYGQQEGHLYYAMELIQGHSVEEELQLGRRFTWREVVQDAIKLCKALRHAHDHGVIHRDLKPANLLLSEADNNIKLTDFGIARLFGNNHLTMDGALVGTAEYMSPEQAAGDRVTPQSDLYSLGGVMFAMLAGRPPFRCPSLAEMLHKQRFEEAPPVSRFVTGIPPELEEFVAKLLSKDPQSRGANALVLSRQLSAMEHGLSAIRQRPAESPETPAVSPPKPLPAADRTVSNHPASPDPRSPTRAIDTPPMPFAYDPNASTMLAPAASLAPPSIAPNSLAQPSTVPPAGPLPIAKTPPDKPQSLAKLSDSDLASPTVVPSASAAAAAPVSSTSPASAAVDKAALKISEAERIGLNAVPPVEAAPQGTIIENRFTTVEEDERRQSEAVGPSNRIATTIQIGLLVASIAMIGGLLWYFTRPASAEKLFARIEAAVREGDANSLVAAEDDVQNFLSRFPDDPHARAVKDYQDEINLQQLEQRFRLHVRLMGRDESLTPVERDYLEAMNWLSIDPQRSTNRLQALVDLYSRTGGKAENSETTQCIELAKRQLQQLREQTAKSIPQYQQLIQSQLRRAEQLRQVSPADAQAIWRGIITLYSDKPWAAADIARAKAALAEMGVSDGTAEKTANGR